MKQLLSLTCLGVLCLLLSNPINAQVSRKGDQGSPKVILKKDKNEPVNERSERSEPEVSRERTSTQSRTQTGGRTYPRGRQQEPSTRQDRRYPEPEVQKYPRSDRKYPTDDRYENRRSGDHEGNDEYSGHSHGKSKGHHNDDHCDHPGKGRHLGWHKQKNKKKGGRG